MSAQASRPAWIAYGVLLGLSLLLLLAVALQLWEPLLLAAVLASALHRPHERLAARLRGRRGLAAFVLNVGVVLLVLAPIATAIILGVQQAAAGVEFLRDAIQDGKLSKLAEALPGPLAKWARGALADVPSTVAKVSQTASEKGLGAAAALGSALSATGRLLLKSFLMLIALYFLLVDGRRLRAFIIASMPMGEARTARLLKEFAVVTKSTLGSLLVSALSQGTAATLGFFVAKVPQPFFFGLLTFFMSFIPSIGTGAVGLPVGVILLLAGRPVAGIFIIAWTLLVVGLIDNLFKPMFIKGKVDIHGGVIFFSLLGGLAMLGPMGLIVGPLAVSFFLAMVRMGGPRAAIVDPAEPPGPTLLEAPDGVPAERH